MGRELEIRVGEPVPTFIPKPLSKTKATATARSVSEHAQDTFGNTEKASHWLNRSNRIFGGKTPLEVMQVDLVSVEAELVRIDYGVYA